jgi:hypothetical protein
VGKKAVGTASVIASAIVFAATSAFLLYALWQFWPPGAPAVGANPPAESAARFLWWDLTMSREKSFFVIVAIAGALGAMAHVLRSFFRYVGERNLLRSWMVSYFLIPFVGAIIGTLIFIVLRAGLITGAGVAQSDPFGFAAVAGLVGLFSGQAAEKLKQVFETIFASPEAGAESVTAPRAVAPAIRAFSPAAGSVGTTVEIEGDALEDVKVVRFGDASAPATFDQDAGELTTTVPLEASSGKIAITLGNLTVVSDTVFEVTAPELPIIERAETAEPRESP